MSNLRELKRRIDSISSTRQITRTMEMVSTAKVGEALERASAAAPYKEAITRMLANVADAVHGDVEHPLLADHGRDDGELLVVIASDRGLAGGFNVVVQREVERRVRKLRSEGRRAEVITCGSKPTEYFRARGIEPALCYTGMSDRPTDEQATQIASYAMDGYTSGTFDRVVIHYNHAKNRVQQEVVREQLLPVQADALAMPNAPRTRESLNVVGADESDYGHTYGMVVSFDPSPAEVLGHLMPAYVTTVIFHALLDSAAAEHGARRRAMKAATDNANAALTTLNRSYNRIRQGSITTELNEIIGGASALEDSQ